MAYRISKPLAPTQFGDPARKARRVAKRNKRKAIRTANKPVKGMKTKCKWVKDPNTGKKVYKCFSF